MEALGPKGMRGWKDMAALESPMDIVVEGWLVLLVEPYSVTHNQVAEDMRHNMGRILHSLLHMVRPLHLAFLAALHTSLLVLSYYLASASSGCSRHIVL